MCLDHHITISEELGESMSLPKDHPDAKHRLRLLEKLGECAFKQGSYHLATKKFTQAGNRVKVIDVISFFFRYLIYLTLLRSILFNKNDIQINKIKEHLFKIYQQKLYGILFHHLCIKNAILNFFFMP